MTTGDISARLRVLASAEDAMNLAWFFKTGPGQYGAGDRFLGIRVPAIRGVVRSIWRETSFETARELLRSPWHEERLCALLIWIEQYRHGDETARRRTYRAYLADIRMVNNWDLVDLSAGHIVGAWLLDRSRRPLDLLAASPLLWKRRVAVVATSHFIARGDFGTTLRVAGMLLNDGEDLIHKATGWMLREVGKRDQAALEKFLKKHAARMPRTMLRYAIERFPETLRREYMSRRHL